jgi:molecular chaperone GrpE
MVKKKTSGQEDPEQINHNESSDIKEDTNLHENGEDNKSADTNESVKDECPTESTDVKEPASDKVDPKEKSSEEKLAEMQDKYLRLSAEFDNYRKRTLREKIDMSKYAGENLILKLLPVMDDFERAVSHMEISNECTSIKEGIDLIYIKFTDFLKQNGVKEIESLNCSFNVDLHDAVAKLAVKEEEKKGKIVDVIQKGYYLQDKVIRHSKVVIGE